MKINKHKKVLNWINSQRKNLGMKPLTALPKGVTGDAESCPIANSFTTKAAQAEVDDELRVNREIPVPKAVHDFVRKLSCDGGYYSELLEKNIVDSYIAELPKYVSDFIVKFDDGKYPELIEE